MNNVFRTGMTALLVCTFAASLTSPAVFAQGEKEKHDSNTLHKLGNAIQYPVRKAATNASITAHQATGKNSVVKKKSHKTGKTVKRVVTPSGHVRVLRHHEKKK